MNGTLSFRPFAVSELSCVKLEKTFLTLQLEVCNYTNALLSFARRGDNFFVYLFRSLKPLAAH